MTDTPSEGELAARIERDQAELTRLQAEDQAARSARFEAELSEVRRGERAAFDEHIEALSPDETLNLLQAGALRHLGFGPSKRRGQR